MVTLFVYFTDGKINRLVLVIDQINAQILVL